MDKYLEKFVQPTLPEKFDDSWGAHLILDAFNCSTEHFGNHEYITAWVKDLVRTIGMVAHGDPEIIYFGHGDPKLAGTTVKQWIETSHIIAHFNDFDGSVPICVFSCKPFNPEEVLKHVVKWWGPEDVKTKFFPRLQINA